MNGPEQRWGAPGLGPKRHCTEHTSQRTAPKPEHMGGQFAETTGSALPARATGKGYVFHEAVRSSAPWSKRRVRALIPSLPHTPLPATLECHLASSTSPSDTSQLHPLALSRWDSLSTLCAREKFWVL
jgi:hypothetical protein